MLILVEVVMVITALLLPVSGELAAVQIQDKRLEKRRDESVAIVSPARAFVIYASMSFADTQSLEADRWTWYPCIQPTSQLCTYLAPLRPHTGVTRVSV